LVFRELKDIRNRSQNGAQGSEPEKQEHGTSGGGSRRRSSRLVPGHPASAGAAPTIAPRATKPRRDLRLATLKNIQQTDKRYPPFTPVQFGICRRPTTSRILFTRGRAIGRRNAFSSQQCRGKKRCGVEVPAGKRRLRIAATCSRNWQAFGLNVGSKIGQSRPLQAKVCRGIVQFTRKRNKAGLPGAVGHLQAKGRAISMAAARVLSGSGSRVSPRRRAKSRLVEGHIVSLNWNGKTVAASSAAPFSWIWASNN